MHLIPVPELVVALVVGVVVLGLRAVRRFRPRPPARRAAGATRWREEVLDIQRLRARLIAGCILLALVNIPLVLKLVPPNGLYGFRTGLTQSSSAIWYPANAFMGWALLAAAGISATALAVLPIAVKRWLLWSAFVLPIFGAIVASFVYLNGLA